MFVTGYPKSGNTWFCYLLAYCLNVPYDNLMEPGVHPRSESQRKLVKGGLLHKSFEDAVKGVWFSHDLATFREYKGKDFTICIVRDGRDVMVSYYHYRNSFLFADGRRAGKHRLLQGLLRPLEPMLEPHRFSAFVRKMGREWKEHVEACLSAGPDMIVRYEDLNREPKQTLKGVFKKLGIVVDDKVIDSAIDLFSFKKSAELEKGKETNARFYRKGIVGDWKNKFRDEDCRYFMEIAGNLLVEFGYAQKGDC